MFPFQKDVSFSKGFKCYINDQKQLLKKKQLLENETTFEKETHFEKETPIENMSNLSLS